MIQGRFKGKALSVSAGFARLGWEEPVVEEGGCEKLIIGRGRICSPDGRLAIPGLEGSEKSIGGRSSKSREMNENKQAIQQHEMYLEIE